MRWLGVFALGLLCAPASAVDFMGLELGDSFAGVRCEDFSYSSATEYMKPGYGDQPVRPCWLPLEDRQMQEIPAVGMLTVAIHPEKARLPPSVSRVMGVIIDGRLEILSAETSGQKVQDEVLAGLKAKYGTPANEKIVGHQNAFGATFDGIEAEWHIESVDIDYRGIVGARDSGRITASTKRGLQHLVTEEAARRAAAPSF